MAILNEDKQYEAAFLSLDKEYLGQHNGQYDFLKYKPANIWNIDGFYDKPYVTSTKPYKTRKILQKNIEAAEMNLLNPDTINQLTTSNLGETLSKDYYKQLNPTKANKKELNPDFKRRFLAYVEQVMVLYNDKNKEKSAGLYVSNMIKKLEENLVEEQFVLDTLKQAFPAQAAQIRFEEVNEDNKVGFVNKLKDMKNKLSNFVSKKVTQAKEKWQELEEEGVIDDVKEYIEDKVEDVKGAFIAAGKGIVKTAKKVVACAGNIASETFKASALLLKAAATPVKSVLDNVSEMGLEKDLDL